MRFKTAREPRRKCSGTGSGRSGKSSNRRIAREKGEQRRAVGGWMCRKMVIKYVQRKQEGRGVCVDIHGFFSLRHWNQN